MTNETNQALENMAYSLGVQAYVWGFPVVVSEHSRLGMARSEEIIPRKLRGPLNTLVSAKALLKAPDNTNAIETSNCMWIFM